MCQRVAPVISVNEHMGDGMYAVFICEKCAEILDLKPGDTLPPFGETLRRLKEAGHINTKVF